MVMIKVLVYAACPSIVHNGRWTIRYLSSLTTNKRCLLSAGRRLEDQAHQDDDLCCGSRGATPQTR